MTSPSSILRSAADLIEPEGAWTQRAFARNGVGAGVNFDDEEAVCFCVAGAIRRLDASWDDIIYLVERTQGVNLITFNDDPRRSQAEVVAKLREVADKLDAEASSPPREPSPSAGDPLDGGVS